MTIPDFTSQLKKRLPLVKNFIINRQDGKGWNSIDIYMDSKWTNFPVSISKEGLETLFKEITLSQK